jgi:hypothetical protein
MGLAVRVGAVGAGVAVAVGVLVGVGDAGLDGDGATMVGEAVAATGDPSIVPAVNAAAEMPTTRSAPSTHASALGMTTVTP